MSELEMMMKAIDELPFSNDFTRIFGSVCKAVHEANQALSKVQEKPRPFKVGDWVVYAYRDSETLIQLSETQDSLVYAEKSDRAYGRAFCRRAKPEEMFKAGARVKITNTDGPSLELEGYLKAPWAAPAHCWIIAGIDRMQWNFPDQFYNCTLLEPAPER